MSEGNLSPRQARFAELLAIGSCSQTEAYRQAYGPGKRSEKSTAEAASRLARSVKVRQRVDELRNEAAKAAGITFAGHLEDLRALRDSAKAAGQHGPAVAAETWRGRAAGFYVDRVRPEDLDKLTEDELEQVTRGKVPPRLKLA